VAELQDLPALIAFTRSCSDDAVRGSAAGAIVRLCQRTGKLEAEEALLTPEVEQAANPAQRTTWLGILALPFLKMDLQSANGQTVNQAKQMLETMAATVKDDGLRREVNASAAAIK
jgi:hypothetical protein